MLRGHTAEVLLATLLSVGAVGIAASKWGEDMAGLILAARSGILQPAEGAQANLRRLGEDLDPWERAAIARRAFIVLDGGEALKWAREGRTALGKVIIVVNPPRVFRKLPPAGRTRLAVAVTDAALRIGATLMVDCTDADMARLNASGFANIAKARGRLWRMVVFDGAHHLPGLALEPELLLLPVTPVGEMRYVNHGYVRDAVSWSDLERAMAALSSPPVALTIPRLSTPVKSKAPLGELGKRALQLLAASSAPAGPGAAERPRPASRTGVFSDATLGAATYAGETAFYAVSLATPPTKHRTERDRQLLQELRSRAPIRRLQLAVGYGNFQLGGPTAAERRRAAVDYAHRIAPALPVHLVGQPYSAWDLLLLKSAAALAGATPRL